MSMTNEQIQALKEKAECICGILENIAGYEPGDIDGDDVELRFETEDGFYTGCTVSIVEQCQSAADIIRSLLAERDADKALIDEQAKRIDELREWNAGLAQESLDRQQRIAELVHNHRIHAARLIAELGQLKERIAELEASHTKLRGSMAAIHNTIRLDGAGITLVVGGE